ncbi:MAG: glycosyltransferase family 39 protein [Acidobacteriaceae bacterium]|nr:glycosyltransferase family 39 protein [Acidobacteriaceae bacterium]
MHEIVRKSPRFFFWVSIGAVALRLLFVLGIPAVTADSFVYGDIAKNWLQHGVYGLSGRNDISPTYIRLPGYPAFLALFFAIFGVEHYRAVLILQVFVDLSTCFLVADIAQRILTPAAAKVAFLLAAFCPFFANYSGAALTETWEIFFTALALDFAIAGLQTSRWRFWLGAGFAVGSAMLLRPDGALLLIAVKVYLAWYFVRQQGTAARINALKAAIVVLIAAFAPLAPWAVRNLRTFHEFQPLAPRYANQEGSFMPMGFERWTKTWIVDYASTEEIYWSVPGSPMDVDQLPWRAFDSEAQRDRTSQLLDDYNRVLRVTPDLDERFAELAAERIHRAPLRYYVWLPLLRIVDMWLRPRTEILPCNSRWWEFDEQTRWLIVNVAFGVVNLLYVAAALFGLVRSRQIAYMGLLLTFVLMRSAFLGTLENPETRYTLECYPVVIVLATALFSRRSKKAFDERSVDLGRSEAQPRGESVMRKRVRTCSDSSSMAERFATGSAWVKYFMASTSKRCPST